MDCIVHGVAKSQTGLSDFHFTSLRSLGFLWWLSGKEPACNAGDLDSMPGLGRSPGEGKATHYSILAWRIPWSIPWGHKET